MLWKHDIRVMQAEKGPIISSTCFVGVRTGASNGTDFECVSSGQVLPASFRCDGDFDCPDHSDEFHCGKRV